MAAIPATVSPRAAGAQHKRRKPDFVARTIVGVSGAIERTVFTEEHARRDGLLQRVDPRVKVMLFALAVLTTGLAHSVFILLGLYALTVALAALSRLPLDLMLKRLLLGIPLFAGIVSIPALFMIGGPTAIHLPNLGPLDLSISSNALWSVATFVTRVVTSVSFGVLLVMTTRWADLLKALRVLRVPEVFIVVLGMTYRYIFLFLRSVESLFMARSSRTVGTTSEQERRQWVGATAGMMLSKSMQMSNDVYQAMVARGFSGDVRTLTTFSMRDEDWLFVAVGVVLLSVTLLADMAL
jgi:cobalt/nickel transport system permease protein